MTAYLWYLFFIVIAGCILVMLDIYIGFLKAIGVWFQDIYWAITGAHRKTNYGINTSAPRIYWVGIIKLLVTIAIVVVLSFSIYRNYQHYALQFYGEMIINESEPDIVNDLYLRATPSAAFASSEPPPASDGTCFDAAMAIDNDIQTCWMVYSNSKNVGEWIRVDYPSLVTAVAITIWPGCWARDSHDFDVYNEPGTLSIQLFNEERIVGECKVSNNGEKECITIFPKKPLIFDAVQISIDSVEKGTYGGGISISEIAVYEKGSRSYISSSDMITDEAFEKMKNQAKVDYSNQIAETWGSGEKLQSFAYIGYYFLQRKEQKVNKNANIIYLVYKCDVTCDENPYSYYHFIEFKNLILNGDGTCSVDIADYDTPSNKLYTDYGYYYYGYESINDVFNSCVQPKLSSYDCENNVKD